MSNTDFSSWLQGNRNIYYGIVLDNQDPLMLGRIRVHPIDENLESLKRRLLNLLKIALTLLLVNGLKLIL